MHTFAVSVFVCDEQMHLKESLDIADFVVVMMQRSLSEYDHVGTLLQSSLPWQRFVESNMDQ